MTGAKQSFVAGATPSIGINDLLPLLLLDRIIVDKAERIAQMAAALRTWHATGSETDAIRCLMGRGFAYGEIVAYLDDALAEARQGIVADTMAKG